MGRAFLALGRTDEAYNAFDEILQTNSASERANQAVMQMLYDSKKFDDLLKHSANYANFNPDDPSSYFYASEACKQKGNKTKAAEFSRKGADRLPEQLDSTQKYRNDYWQRQKRLQENLGTNFWRRPILPGGFTERGWKVPTTFDVLDTARSPFPHIERANLALSVHPKMRELSAGYRRRLSEMGVTELAYEDRRLAVIENQTMQAGFLFLELIIRDVVIPVKNKVHSMRVERHMLRNKPHNGWIGWRNLYRKPYEAFTDKDWNYKKILHVSQEGLTTFQEVYGVSEMIFSPDANRSLYLLLDQLPRELFNASIDVTLNSLSGRISRYNEFVHSYQDKLHTAQTNHSRASSGLKEDLAHADVTWQSTPDLGGRYDSGLAADIREQIEQLQTTESNVTQELADIYRMLYLDHFQMAVHLLYQKFVSELTSGDTEQIVARESKQQFVDLYKTHVSDAPELFNKTFILLTNIYLDEFMHQLRTGALDSICMPEVKERFITLDNTVRNSEGDAREQAQRDMLTLLRALNYYLFGFTHEILHPEEIDYSENNTLQQRVRVYSEHCKYVMSSSSRLPVYNDEQIWLAARIPQLLLFPLARHHEVLSANILQLLKASFELQLQFSKQPAIRLRHLPDVTLGDLLSITHDMGNLQLFSNEILMNFDGDQNRQKYRNHSQRLLQQPTVTPSNFVTRTELKGEIPELGEFSFEEPIMLPNPNDVNYGFAAFGLTIEKCITQLLENAADITLRQIMANEIMTFVLSGLDNSVILEFDSYRELYEQHQLIKTITDIFLQEVKRTHDWQGDVDSIITERYWYTDDDINFLLRHYLELPESGLMTAIDMNYQEGETLAENLAAREREIEAREVVYTDTLVFPINISNSHWVALVIKHSPDARNSPEIYYYNPFGSPMQERLRTILHAQYSELTDENIIESNTRHQNNTYDCGPWIVAILEAFINREEDLAEDFNIESTRQEHEKLLDEDIDRSAALNRKKGELFKLACEFKLQKLLPAEIKQHQMLSELVMREDVFRYYIETYRYDKNWFTTPDFASSPNAAILSAIAEINRISVYYWRSDTAENNKLKLIRTDEHNSPRMAHFFYDPALKALVPLVIKSRPAVTRSYVDNEYYMEDVAELRRLAEEGNAKAQAILGKYLMAGYGLDRNYDEALQWLNQSVEQTDSDGRNTLGLMHLFAHGVARDPARALELFNLAIAQGNKRAVCNKGILYLNGWGVEQDRTQAFKLFEQATIHHIAEGLLNLALCYRHGWGVTQNPIIARNLLEIILRDYKPIPSNQAFSFAKFNLSEMYSEGEGGIEKIELAKQYVRDLLDSNISPIVAQLGAWYYSGFMHANDADYTHAFNLFRRALQLNTEDVISHSNIGLCYHYGRGTDLNYQFASQHFSAALEGGHQDAASFLGKMAYHGQGTNINHAEAFRLCTLASNLPNNQQAIFYLGLMHEFGYGVRRNVTTARDYYERNSQRNHKASLSRRVGFWSRSEYGNYKPALKPDIAVNTNGIVIVVSEPRNKREVVCRVGRVDDVGHIEWCNTYALGDEENASVALNDNGLVVIVAEQVGQNKLLYKVGQLQNDLTITWGSWYWGKKGLRPSVSIDNEGNVIEVHESHELDRLWHRVGKMNGTTINWKEDRYYSAGKQPSVALYNNGSRLKVVEIHRESDSPYRLRCSIGYVNTDNGKIDWDGHWWKPDPIYRECGETPSVRINQEGKVLVCHRESSSSNTLLYRRGTIDTGRSIDWQDAEPVAYDAGFIPAAVVDHNEQILAVHEHDEELCFARPENGPG